MGLAGSEACAGEGFGCPAPNRGTTGAQCARVSLGVASRYGKHSVNDTTLKIPGTPNRNREPLEMRARREGRPAGRPEGGREGGHERGRS